MSEPDIVLRLRFDRERASELRDLLMHNAASEIERLRARVAELEAARVNDAKVYSVPVDAAALLADLRDELARTRNAFMDDARAMRQRNGELREVLHGLISVRFNEDAAEVEAAYDAAKDTLRAGLSAGGG